MMSVAPAILHRQRQQWIALAGMLAVLAAGIVALLAVQYHSVLDGEGQRLRAQVRVVDRNLSRQLWSTNQALGELIHELDYWQSTNHLDRANAWMRTMTQSNPGLRTMSFLDAQGRVIASNRPEIIGREFADREYFQVARAGNSPDTLYVSQPFLSALGAQVVNLTRVIQNEHHGFNGLVVATLDPSYFTVLLNSVNFAPDVWSGVAHGQGRLFVLTPPNDKLIGRDLRAPGSMFTRHVESGLDETLLVGEVALTHDTRIMAQHTVRPPDVQIDHPFVVAISRSRSAVLAGLRNLALSASLMYALLLATSTLGLRWIQRAERRAARALGETLDRIERIAVTAPGAICQFEMTPAGQAFMPYSTRPLEPFFGVSVSGEPGSADPLFSYIHPGDVDRVRDAILVSARTLQPFRQEFRIHVPGQPERWLEVHSVPQHLADGSTRWTGLVTDASEQRAAREAGVALESAQRASRAKSEFLSRASHELRTPLNAVIGFSSILLGSPGSALSKVEREQIGYIHDAGEHLLALINDLLDVSAIESGRITAEIADVPVAPLVGEVLSTMRETASAAGVHLSAQVDDPHVAVRADRVRLKQVLLNLLSNAVKYNRRDGAVLLEVSGLADGQVIITVEDTGAGMSREQVAHLFEPFNRLGAERRGIAGTGIGLTIAKMLLELMHGKITVDSTPGRGSRFVVTLPGTLLAGEPARRSEPADLTATRSASALPLRVLYVEDNAMNAVFVEQLLALRPNVVLQVAHSAAEAIQAMSQHAPDLALVDIHLGDANGVDLVRELRARPGTASLRCVAVTADATTETAQRAADAGFIGYVTKPINANELLRVIDREASRRAVSP